jgi:hypothetical protein
MAIYCDTRSGSGLRAKRSRWILLYPKDGSNLQREVKRNLSAADEDADIVDDPRVLHNLLLTTVLPNWQEYMLHLEKRLLDLVSTDGTDGIIVC